MPKEDISMRLSLLTETEKVSALGANIGSLAKQSNIDAIDEVMAGAGGKLVKFFHKPDARSWENTIVPLITKVAAEVSKKAAEDNNDDLAREAEGWLGLTNVKGEKLIASTMDVPDGLATAGALSRWDIPDQKIRALKLALGPRGFVGVTNMIASNPTIKNRLIRMMYSASTNIKDAGEGLSGAGAAKSSF